MMLGVGDSTGVGQRVASAGTAGALCWVAGMPVDAVKSYVQTCDRRMRVGGCAAGVEGEWVQGMGGDFTTGCCRLW